MTSSIRVIAPGDVPQEVTLILQIRREGEVNFTDYTSGIGAGQSVTVSGLQACAWYALRWKTQQSS
jgi:hypothetical protein